MNTPERKRLFVMNEPQPLRIDRKLAEEIGLLESIVLLQIEYLLANSDNYRDGRYWMYNTLKTMKAKYFPWLSIATLSRTLINLEVAGYILRGNYNKTAYDRTQWFALDYDGIAKLTSVRVTDDGVSHNEKRPTQKAKTDSHNAKTLLQNAKWESQNGTTIPDNIPDKDTEEKQTTAVAISADPSPPVNPVVVAPDRLTPVSNTPIPACVEKLIAAGVTPSIAETLASRHAADKIEAVLHSKRLQTAQNPGGFIRRALEQGYALETPVMSPERPVQHRVNDKPPGQPTIGTESALTGIKDCRKKLKGI